MEEGSLINYSFLFASFSVMIVFSLDVASVFVPEIQQEILRQASDWAQVTCMAFVLSAITLVIREAKPEFARYPRVFALLPLCIVPVHYFGMHTLVLKDWVLGIYQAGALIIGALLYGSWLFRDVRFLTSFIAVMILMVTFLFYWSPFGLGTGLSSNVWRIGIIIGLILLNFGVEQTKKLGYSPVLHTKTGNSYN